MCGGVGWGSNGTKRKKKRREKEESVSKLKPKSFFFHRKKTGGEKKENLNRQMGYGAPHIFISFFFFFVHGGQFDVGERQKWTKILVENCSSAGERLGERLHTRVATRRSPGR